jgi:FimV-like protein
VAVAAAQSQEEGTRIPIGDRASLDAAAVATTGLASAQVPWNFSDDWALIKKKWYAWVNNPLSLRLLGAVVAGLLVLLLLILLGGLAHWRASRAKIAEIDPAVEPVLAHQADSVIQRDEDDEIAKMPPAMAALDLTLPDLPEEPAPSAASPSSPQNKIAHTKVVHHKVTHSKTIHPEVAPPEATHPKATHHKAAHSKAVHQRAAHPPKAADSAQTTPSSSTSGTQGTAASENPSLAMAREYIALGTATQTRARALLEDLLSSNDPATRAAAQALLDISRTI